MAILREPFDAGTQVIAVVSAMSGVTDALTEAARAAAAGERSVWQETALQLRMRHGEVLQQLVGDGSQRAAAQAEMDALVSEFEEVCGALDIVGELTPRIHDQILAFGERLSSRVIASALRSAGLPARQFDATQLIVTDDNHLNASVENGRTQVCIDRVLLPALEQGELPVITGYIGRTREGAMTTLGRGGSDYSAALIAAASHSDELTIWTDVDGVMTTDPRIDAARPRIVTGLLPGSGRTGLLRRQGAAPAYGATRAGTQHPAARAQHLQLRAPGDAHRRTEREQRNCHQGRYQRCPCRPADCCRQRDDGA